MPEGTIEPVGEGLGADAPGLALRCPRCDYDISGPVSTWTDACPVEGLCTECGLRFNYRDVFLPLLDVPEWFFELARRRRVRALLSTALGTCRPARFWSTVKLSFPFRRRRLMIFAFAVLLSLHLLGALGVFLLEGFGGNAVYRQVWNPTQRQWTATGFDWALVWPTVRSAIAWPGLPPIDVLGWHTEIESPWFVLLFLLATPAGFLFLGESLGKARVRAAHVWRAVVYAATPIVGYCTVVVVLFIGAMWYWRSVNWNWWTNRNTPMPWLLSLSEWTIWNEFILIAPIVPATFFIWWAICRRYFQIDHAVWVALSVTLIGLLATLVPLLALTSCLTSYVMWFI